ncbi:4'-phosphopantetheinyl transferase family protein [Saccharophagus degradans]|uniref:4'-phosphopantetheinyl transferase superfamily protein n=1 Tax=Saccharophagus degradans TaxID=86304 RepID=A0AAW7X1A2_9GAMM|nr:4'-phosphopantetheinyl transferase superfamily protein [Saccharophagus degradans]MDO6421247.1 4'-phosphopantetheinyl transferase superfamily protein [Saccharophagus degradans]MDO6605842.1 4'-phosphopantetheinyl transferase superfamily protein [Saccharophagus degradans]
MPGNITVYFISLDKIPSDFYSQSNSQLLTLDEQYRLAKIKCKRRYREYLCGHILARVIIAHHQNATWQSIILQTDKQGKPYITTAGTRISFNISHSGEWWTLALGEAGEIGVDIESPCNRSLIDEDILPIAKRNFSAQENSLLNTATIEFRKKHFYRIWTIKEAILKAVGVGLTGPALKDIDTGLGATKNTHSLLTADGTILLHSDYQYLDITDCHLAIASTLRLGDISIVVNPIDWLVSEFNHSTNKQYVENIV